MWCESARASRYFQLGEGPNKKGPSRWLWKLRRRFVVTSSTYTLYCPATGRDRIKEDADYVICIIYYKLQIEWLPFTLLTFIYFAAAAERCELKYLHCSIKVSDRVTLGCHLSSVISFHPKHWRLCLPLITASHPAHYTLTHPLNV